MPRHFYFIDDAVGPDGDAERYRAVLSGGDLIVTLMAPNRETLLVPEDKIPQDVAGYILDINLRDALQLGSDQRFLGTGAGLAQDLRLLQASGGGDRQKPRPIVRLCAAQVFQQYIAGDNSTADVFDLGFAKEMIGDIAPEARNQIASLPDIYEGIMSATRDPAGAAAILGLTEEKYSRLHSGFRSVLELELEKKTHETASFLLRALILPAGLLISERLLVARLGIDEDRTPLEARRRALGVFDAARYRGKGYTGFPRWWAGEILGIWSGISGKSLFGMSADERVAALAAANHPDLVAIGPTKESPGDRPWLLAHSDEERLRVPVDPRYAYPLSLPGKPWLDDLVWSLEQAKTNRRSKQLSEATRTRLSKDIRAQAAG
jgi:hypothetical protein